MLIMAVDDEFLALEDFEDTCREVGITDEIVKFNNPIEALGFVACNKVDIAFLDISMRGMGGLTLAETLLEMQPDCKIVFCTGYTEYAVDAFKIHVSGYLMKPITAQAVQKEIDHIKGQKAKERLLTVKCFGNFEAYANREPLNFKSMISNIVIPK